VIRRKILTLIGAAFHVFDHAGNVVLYSRQKAFRLREDLRLFTGEDMSHEVLRIAARQIIDFGATYEVVDSQTDQHIGSLRRRGFKSLLRDEWTFLDPDGREIGRVIEDDSGLAILRRVIDVVTFFIPQEYHIQSNGQTIGQYRRRRNPFVHRVEVNLTADSTGHIDRRLALAGGLLLCAIEGRQR
ncbi:MAG: hypothetical protein L0Y42_00220, partial [Phycisphaerales bacterium]|nr:hypothetical protein [Phycisphaerales bacterium]